jgi:phage tail sheath protein FI
MCGSDTMTQTDIDRGIVNVVIGFAPLKPAALMLRGAEAKTRSSPGLAVAAESRGMAKCREN